MYAYTYTYAYTFTYIYHLADSLSLLRGILKRLQTSSILAHNPNFSRPNRGGPFLVLPRGAGFGAAGGALHTPRDVYDDNSC